MSLVDAAGDFVDHATHLVLLGQLPDELALIFAGNAAPVKPSNTRDLPAPREKHFSAAAKPRLQVGRDARYDDSQIGVHHPGVDPRVHAIDFADVRVVLDVVPRVPPHRDILNGRPEFFFHCAGRVRRMHSASDDDFDLLARRTGVGEFAHEQIENICQRAMSGEVFDEQGDLAFRPDPADELCQRFARDRSRECRRHPIRPIALGGRRHRRCVHL